MTPCPVCGASMQSERDRIEGTTCEEYDECPRGCYRYEFLYGSSSWIIAGREWHQHYTDDSEVMDRGVRERAAWIAELRSRVQEKQS